MAKKTMAQLKAEKEAAAKAAAATATTATTEPVAGGVDPEVAALVEASGGDVTTAEVGEKTTTTPEADERIKRLQDENAKLADANEQLRKQIEGQNKRDAEGLSEGETIHTAPVKMAGHMPADVSLIPTVDEINARGQN